MAVLQAVALLGGAHVYEESPRGVNASYVSFGECETRDWSVFDHKAHEHLVSIRVRTNARSQKLAQQIVSEIEAALLALPQVQILLRIRVMLRIQ